VVSKRIKAVVSQISGKVLADIGTDHGYIAIEALREQRVSRAILCDINRRPLQRASENISAAGLNDRAEVRLGNGLTPLRPGEADCISIAGMGGMLMIEILKAEEPSPCLVLQPQLDINAVRRFVHSIGFKIADEQMLFEGRFYTVMRCERGFEEYTDAEYEYGRLLIERKDSVLKQYLIYRITELEKILRMHESAEIIKEKNICGEVLNCM